MTMENMTIEEIFSGLNASDREARLSAVRAYKAGIDAGRFDAVSPGHDVNNHVHTSYSFSPYSPSKAVLWAYRAGLEAVGIVDHDSVSGAEEFLAAAKTIGILPTVGLEIRVDMKDTPIYRPGRRINSPDQDDAAYVALHGIPHQELGVFDAFLRPIREKRGLRNRQMTARINDVLRPFGLSIDYEKDVLPISMAKDGGSVTERHLLFALGLKMIEKYGKGAALVRFLKEDLGEQLPEAIEGYLLDEANPNYAYDLLGLLKSAMLERFLIRATDELVPLGDYIDLARRTGAISAYAYLGDVGDSVTGDKKTQSFEDAYLDELIPFLVTAGFNAVTYMPSRNTKEQLSRLRALCDRYGLFQISGEDINQPRQSFICYAQRDPVYADLYDSTMAMIGSERRATLDLSDAMFSEKSVRACPDLGARIRAFGSFRDAAGDATL